MTQEQSEYLTNPNDNQSNGEHEHLVDIDINSDKNPNKKLKKEILSVRLPDELLTSINDIALCTEQSRSQVIMDALQYYVSEYAESEEYGYRLNAHLSQINEAGSDISTDTPPPKKRHKNTTANPFALRLDKELYRNIRNVSLGLGVTLSDVVTESCTLWVEHYPNTHEFSDRVCELLQIRNAALARLAIHSLNTRKP